MRWRFDAAGRSHVEDRRSHQKGGERDLYRGKMSIHRNSPTLISIISTLEASYLLLLGILCCHPSILPLSPSIDNLYYYQRSLYREEKAEETVFPALTKPPNKRERERQGQDRPLGPTAVCLTPTLAL